MSVPAALAAHYQQLLGLVNPWKITHINLDVAEQRLDIRLEWLRGRKAPCPECGKRCGLKDHLTERTWRHLDSMQFKTFLHCRIPRSECSTHGTRAIPGLRAESGSQWTLLFEAFAVLVMGQVASLTKAANLLGVSWKEAYTLRKHAVARGLGRRSIDEIYYVGIDEKSFRRKERFLTGAGPVIVFASNVASKDNKLFSYDPSSNITIGSQTWSGANLNVSKFRDNTDIPYVDDSLTWVNTTEPAWCWYDNDPLMGQRYEELYNWYAVSTTAHGGIAPVGEHIPTDAEWTTLAIALGADPAVAPTATGWFGSDEGGKQNDQISRQGYRTRSLQQL
jgi:uncharacterized protein (TIGR02145 family)